MAQTKLDAAPEDPTGRSALPSSDAELMDWMEKLLAGDTNVRGGAGERGRAEAGVPTPERRVGGLGMGGCRGWQSMGPTPHPCLGPTPHPCLGPTPHQVPINFNYASEYFPDLGFFVAVDGAIRLPRQLPSAALLTFTPPGSFYLARPGAAAEGGRGRGGWRGAWGGKTRCRPTRP
jgi:hypothetical protein